MLTVERNVTTDSQRTKIQNSACVAPLWFELGLTTTAKEYWFCSLPPPNRCIDRRKAVISYRMTFSPFTTINQHHRQ